MQDNMQNYSCEIFNLSVSVQQIKRPAAVYRMVTGNCWITSALDSLMRVILLRYIPSKNIFYIN